MEVVKKKKQNRCTSKLREELKEDSKNSFRGQINISTGVLLLKCDNVVLKNFSGFYFANFHICCFTLS